MSVYFPREDSYILLEAVRKYAEGNVLDLGTGSGILAIEASKSKKVKSVVASDIDKNALEYAKKSAEKEKIKKNKIKFVHSDLFSSIRGKFDTIIFNPPYLPSNKKYPDVALDGGRRGYELIEKFLSQANNHLSHNGKILIVFSSLTKKEKVEEIIEKYLFEYAKVAEQKIFLETLYVYLIKKSKLLVKLNKKGIKNPEKFAKGRRGIIYTGFWRNKKVAVKSKRKDSSAKGRIQNEAKWLKILNKKSIGPKFLFSKDDFFVYEFVEGDFILDYFAKGEKRQILSIIENVFCQLLVLDKLKINKEEMHHPIKHIIIEKNKPVLIDFERSHKTEKPKNITQFCQFLMGDYVINALNKKGIKINKEKIMEFAKRYRLNSAFPTEPQLSRKMQDSCSSSSGHGISIRLSG